MTQHDAEKLVHARVIFRLVYYNSLLFLLPCNSLRTHPKCCSQNSDRRGHITAVLASLQSLPVEKSRTIFKIPFLTCNVRRGQPPSQLEEHSVASSTPNPNRPLAPLSALKAGLLGIPRITKSRMEDQTFSHRGVIKQAAKPLHPLL